MKTIRVVAAIIRSENKIFATQRGYGEFEGGWEFPGGKIEPGETPQEALKREIKEELTAEIEVGELIDTVEYDYPKFHLSMDCFWCTLVSGHLTLLEAEDAKWLSFDELYSVDWLPADKGLIEKIKTGVKMKAISSWHVGVAAEAFAAAVFARYGYDVSVQYGANQPEYDLISVSGDKMLKISVKGSQDGSWGLTQSYKKDCSYHEAIDKWLNDHHKKTVFCLVQFKNTAPDEMPRIYLATPEEIAKRMKATAAGRGDTILYENHTWGPRAFAKGTTDRIPNDWLISSERLSYMFNVYGQ